MTTEDTTPGDYSPSLRAIRRAGTIDRSQAAGDRAFYNAQEIDSDPSRFWEAVAQYEKAILRFQETGDRWHSAYASFRLAKLYRHHAQPRDALDLFIEAERLFRLQRKNHLRALSLNEIGNCYEDLSEFDPAAVAYRGALEVARKTGAVTDQARFLHNLGFLSQSRGDSWNSLGFFRQALALWRSQKGSASRAGEGETLTGIGWVYASTGDWQRAVDAHWAALRLRNRLGAFGPRAVSLTQLGNVWLRADPHRALPFFEKAWNLQKKGNVGLADRAATLNGLGLALRFLGRYDEAHDVYRKALTQYQAAGDLGGQAANWNNLGWASIYLHQPKEAFKSFEEGLRLARLAHNPVSEARALQGMADSEYERGNTTVAQTRAEESLKIVESLRAAVVRPDLQASYLAANDNVYGLLVRILMEHHRQQPGGGFDLQALSRSEQARARVLVDSLRESREFHNLRGKAAPELLARRSRVMAEIGKQDSTRWRPDASAADVAAAEQALGELIDQLSEIDTLIRLSRHGDLPATPSPISASELCRRLLDGRTLLLEYYIGSPHSYLWAASTDSIQCFELPGSDVLEPLLRSAYNRLAGISNEGPAGEQRLLELSRLLLGPVASQMRGKRLLIAADGSQQFLPFAALPNPGGRHEPLLLENEIVYIPSLQALDELRGRGQDRQSARLMLAILADPVFDSSDRRLTGSGPVSPGSRLQDVFLPRLLNSRQEADAIAALLPPAQTLMALDFDASRDLVTGGRLSRYRILHFATHGFQSSERPELSSLVLSRFDRQGNPIDGYLRVPDLAVLDLPADLIVLSGCETAIGPQMQGEGLVGLPQAFFAAGAQRVLVSLWQVEDESTAALMEQFYRRLLLDRLPAGRALQEAQLAIRKQPRWSSPRYWAGFVLQGDWQ